MPDSPASFRNEFLAGARTTLTPMLVAAPFGALFGALAIKNGLSVFEAVLMSMTVFAGASQMVGIDLFGQKVAPWLIVLSIFAVNFRHVLYSAVIGRRTAHLTPLQRFAAFFFLIDPHFAEAERRAERGFRLTFAWLIGGGLVWWFGWVFVTFLGAYFGSLIPNPEALGLDFLLPVYFLGLVMAFRRRPNWAPVVLASGLASIAAYHFVGSPWHVSLGALAGVLVAAALGEPEQARVIS